jgi:hypothetical protein
VLAGCVAGNKKQPRRRHADNANPPAKTTRTSARHLTHVHLRAANHLQDASSRTSVARKLPPQSGDSESEAEHNPWILNAIICRDDARSVVPMSASGSCG